MGSHKKGARETMQNPQPSFLPGGSDPLREAVNGRHRNVIEMVRDAVKHGHTRLAYQPIVVAEDRGRIGFYEGLIRVLDSTGRVIPAQDFMPVVERTELGRDLDVLALQKGLLALHQTPTLRLAINMSARSIGYARWMQTLQRGLNRNRTIGERLVLEITETSAMDQPEITADFMNRLSRHGICFAIDDFGTGYTALRYFKQFYFDILKIDGTFCRGISDDPDNAMLVRAMISIAQHFDMLTVAEGVESASDVAFLTELGIDFMQGYYFAAPTLAPPWKRTETGGPLRQSNAA